MYSVLLFLHMVALAMAVGTSFNLKALGGIASELPPEERGAFMLRAFGLIRVAAMGLALLLLSGLGMVALRAQVLFQVGGKAFLIKLALVVIQLVLFALLHKTLKRVHEAQGGPLMARVPKLGRALLLNALAIVLSAVLAFH